MTDQDFHLENFSRIARELVGATQRVVVSIVDPYDKAARRLARLGEEQPKFRYRPYEPERDEGLLRQLARAPPPKAPNSSSINSSIPVQRDLFDPDI